MSYEGMTISKRTVETKVNYASLRRQLESTTLSREEFEELKKEMADFIMAVDYVPNEQPLVKDKDVKVTSEVKPPKVLNVKEAKKANKKIKKLAKSKKVKGTKIKVPKKKIKKSSKK